MNHSSLISADQHWMILAILFTIATIGFYLERTRLGAKISGAMISIVLGFALSNLKILPVTADVYDMVWSYFVPLAIPLLLFKANLKKIFREAGPTLLAFSFGIIGSVLGTIISFYLIPLGEEGWKIAGIFCATYVGGSMNYVAVAEALQLKSSELLTAGIAADNLMMSLYFLILFALPGMKIVQKFFPIRHEISGSNGEEKVENHLTDFNHYDLITSLTIALILAAISFSIESFIQIKGAGILILTALTVAVASIYHDFFGKIKGSSETGTLFMQVFFAVIGSSANIFIVLKVGPVLFAFAAVILLVHLIFILLMGKLLRLDIREIVIASNANMGGPTTSAAMAAAKKWQHLILPAILSGTFGYAVANFIGVFVGHFLK